MNDDMNFVSEEESPEQEESVTSADAGKYTKIIFTAVIVIFFLISVISSQRKSMQSEISAPQPQNGTVTEQNISGSSDDVNVTDAAEEGAPKTTSDYLHDIKIGKSNVLALAVLGGALAYVQILRENGEKQKERK